MIHSTANPPTFQQLMELLEIFNARLTAEGIEIHTSGRAYLIKHRNRKGFMEVVSQHPTLATAYDVAFSEVIFETIVEMAYKDDEK